MLGRLIPFLKHALSIIVQLATWNLLDIRGASSEHTQSPSDANSMLGLTSKSLGALKLSSEWWRLSSTSTMHTSLGGVHWAGGRLSESRSYNFDLRAPAAWSLSLTLLMMAYQSESGTMSWDGFFRTFTRCRGCRSLMDSERP